MRVVKQRPRLFKGLPASPHFISSFSVALLKRWNGSGCGTDFLGQSRGQSNLVS